MAKDKTDLSTTIIGTVPIAVVLLNKFGIKIDLETQGAIAALAMLFTSYFVGKPSSVSKRLRQMAVNDMPEEGDR